MAQPQPSSPYRLMVEGTDDQHSVIHLLARHGYQWESEMALRPFVQTAGGRDAAGFDNLIQAVPVALKSHRRLGVVVDMDLVPDNRWGRLRACLRASGVEVPQAVPREGLVVNGVNGSGGCERFGVWLMPDNEGEGMLEDFLVKLVPGGDLRQRSRARVAVQVAARV